VIDLVDPLVNEFSGDRAGTLAAMRGGKDFADLVEV
jgi:hypothetical protein